MCHGTDRASFTLRGIPAPIVLPVTKVVALDAHPARRIESRPSAMTPQGQDSDVRTDERSDRCGLSGLLGWRPRRFRRGMRRGHRLQRQRRTGTASRPRRVQALRFRLVRGVERPLCPPLAQDDRRQPRRDGGPPRDDTRRRAALRSRGGWSPDRLRFRDDHRLPGRPDRQDRCLNPASVMRDLGLTSGAPANQPA